MSATNRWPEAALAGLASSMRTTAAPAALAARGRIGGKARVAVLLGAASELAADKSPFASARTASPALIGRIGAGAYSGRVIAGTAGLVVGAASAAVGTVATMRARSLAVEYTGLPDPVVAVGEDVLALTAAAVATHAEPETPAAKEEASAAPQPSLLRGAAVGVAAGLAGTAAMSLAQGAAFALTQAEPSDSPFTIADRLKRRTGFGRVARKHKQEVNQAMHFAYGTSWGIPFGLLTERAGVRPELAGPAWGLAVWAAALVHQPALRIADPPWKRSAAALSSEALFHVVYGIGAGAAARALRASS